MSDVTQSFFSLLKSNNGHWKSAEQRKFLLSQCQEPNIYTTIGQVFNNSYEFYFYCDGFGVTEVHKITKNKETVWWKRNENHEEFLREKEKHDKELQEHMKNVAWITKARTLVNKHKYELAGRLVKMMNKDKGNQVHLEKVAKLYIKWDKKLTDIEKQADVLEFGNEE